MMPNHQLGNPPNEILVLAEHHLQILKLRFPNYDYSLHKQSKGCSIFVTTISKFLGVGSAILEAFFQFSHVHIRRNHTGKQAPYDVTVVNYADPRFTDDFIGDILKRSE